MLIPESKGETISKETCNRFGLLIYPGTGNLGDEIQSVAARRFLPHVDTFFDRENLSQEFRAEEAKYTTIMNGWYCHHPQLWPPAASIDPIFTSVHISREPTESGAIPAEAMLSGPSFRYLHAFSPIGARDASTLELLRNAGIDSYFSGCLTLTIVRPDVERDSNLVVLCDVSDRISDHVKRQTSKKIVSVTHSGEGGDCHRRYARAEQLLAVYSAASCVVTTRLHCALPCLAVQTPVLLIFVAHDTYRFQGLQELVHFATEEQFLDDRAAFNPDNPPRNSGQYLPLRRALERSVSRQIWRRTHSQTRGGISAR
jgi:hypothetical protein